MPNMSSPMRMVFGNQTLRGFAFGPLVDLATLKADLNELFNLHRTGVLRVATTCWPTADARKARAMLASRSTTGKLVLIPETSSG